jgi:CspA family cold shock protein
MLSSRASRVLRALPSASASAAAARRALATGTTKWFSAKKGFGFLKPDAEGEADLFVHQSAIQCVGQQFRFLHEAEKVTYDVEKTDKGLQACNVRDAAGKPFNRPPGSSSEGGGGGGGGGGG